MDPAPAQTTARTDSTPRPPLAGVLDVALASPSLAAIVERITADAAFGGHLPAPQGARPFVAGAVRRGLGDGGHLVVVVASGREAEVLTADLSDLLGADAVAHFPSWETLPHEKLSPGVETSGRRTAIIRRLLHPEEDPRGPLRVVVTAARGLIQPIAPQVGAVAPLLLEEDEEVDFDTLPERLAEFGYERVDVVGQRGDFAVRGGLVDVFPATDDLPVRVEFWGDEITDIRRFTPGDQRSTDAVPGGRVAIHPCRELLLTPDVRDRAAALSAQADRGGEVTVDPARDAVVEALGRIAEGIPTAGMEALIPELVEGEMRLLPRLAAQRAGATVLVCDEERVRRRAADLATTGREFYEAGWQAAALGASAPIEVEAAGFRSLRQIHADADDAGAPWWTTGPVAPAGAQSAESGAGLGTEDADDVVPAAATAGTAAAARGSSLATGPAPGGDVAQLEKLHARLRDHTSHGGRAVVTIASAGGRKRLLSRLAEDDVPARELALGEQPWRGVVSVFPGTLAASLTIDVPPVDAPRELTAALSGDERGLFVLAESDLTGHRAAQPSRRGPSKKRVRVDPLALTKGDYVVHDQHGIGRFVELTERTIRSGDGTSRREYLVLEFAPSKRGQAADQLFVPMESLDLLSRYVGGEKPTLSKMGGSDWKQTKRKARAEVREIADELIRLYAARQASAGHAFSPDTPWQKEMEDDFPFVETEDQLQAIAEVKADMERPVPMDRVIIGDVGYGKTEVAVRAAFKAVQDGRQVAILVPTTLLAQQHAATFQERLAGTPVTVRTLSRFTSRAESAETIAGLQDGSVDIVVGTHRLLATGVTWKSLGLVIIDEEQRFGVEAKEHIKALKADVDVLTMSATPIPRTLEMSLAGIREMSQILTPPQDRLPVLTYVGAHDPKHVAAAIRRELLRDGQVFYVHNRVESIDSVAESVRTLVPEARVIVAHGQMPEHVLEQTVQGFWNREFDVLVCTTIVETGLDISNANTLIVDRADRMGLAQLHQLRGRVGRSRERGYAYFLYPPERALTTDAHDRLATIAQNNELGAGMAVAMKDLEMRGAGNVLGQAQSGHLAGVGFDLYMRLVGEAVSALRAAVDGEAVPTQQESVEVHVELPVDAHIPATYVAEERLRLEAYRSIAAASDEEGLRAAIAELVDRYGPVPEEVVRLVSVARLRRLAGEFGVTHLSATQTELKMSPLQLTDSQQVRLRRLYAGARWRATTAQLAIPLPREGGRLGAPRIRDLAIVQCAADVLLTLHGREAGEVTVDAAARPAPTAATAVPATAALATAGGSTAGSSGHADTSVGHPASGGFAARSATRRTVKAAPAREGGARELREGTARDRAVAARERRRAARRRGHRGGEIDD